MHLPHKEGASTTMKVKITLEYESCTYPTKKGLLQHLSYWGAGPKLLHLPHKEGASTTSWRFKGASLFRCTYPTKKGLLQLGTYTTFWFKGSCTYPTKKGLLQHSSLLLIRLLMLHIPHKEGASTTARRSCKRRTTVALTPRRRGFYNPSISYRVVFEKVALTPRRRGFYNRRTPHSVASPVALTPQRRGFYNYRSIQPKMSTVALTPQRRGFYNKQEKKIAFSFWLHLPHKEGASTTQAETP